MNRNGQTYLLTYFRAEWSVLSKRSLHKLSCFAADGVPRAPGVGQPHQTEHWVSSHFLVQWITALRLPRSGTPTKAYRYYKVRSHYGYAHGQGKHSELFKARIAILSRDSPLNAGILRRNVLSKIMRLSPNPFHG
jgi:hypothetical protein